MITKLVKKQTDTDGSVLLLVIILFIPIITLITMVMIQFNNNMYLTGKVQENTQLMYLAEMGIERYKNNLIADKDYSSELSFSKAIDTKTYNIRVTSTRIGSGETEKVDIVSTVLGYNITVQRKFSLSRITP